MDCDLERLPTLQKRLSMYKLRADVTLEDASPEVAIFGCFGDRQMDIAGLDSQTVGASASFGDGLASVDPRLAEMGLRIILPIEGAVQVLETAGLTAAGPDAWETHRLSLGVPEAGHDVLIEKSMPLECNFDELGAISYTKGCYVGQELTARMRYRATVKRRLLPVAIEGDAPKPGTLIMLGDKEAGEMRSSFEDIGLALLRLDALATLHEKGGVLTAGDTTLSPLRPPWMTASSEEPPIG